MSIWFQLRMVWVPRTPRNRSARPDARVRTHDRARVDRGCVSDVRRPRPGGRTRRCGGAGCLSPSESDGERVGESAPDDLRHRTERAYARGESRYVHDWAGWRFQSGAPAVDFVRRADSHESEPGCRDSPTYPDHQRLVVAVGEGSHVHAADDDLLQHDVSLVWSRRWAGGNHLLADSDTGESDRALLPDAVVRVRPALDGLQLPPGLRGRAGIQPRRAADSVGDGAA